MDNHFEVMWDMFRDVPSIENPNISVLMNITGLINMIQTTLFAVLP